MAGPEPVEVEPTPAERLACLYREAARGDAWAALVAAVEDALAEREAGRRRAAALEGLVSRGYVRAGPGDRSA